MGGNIPGVNADHSSDHDSDADISSEHTLAELFPSCADIFSHGTDTCRMTTDDETDDGPEPAALPMTMETGIQVGIPEPSNVTAEDVAHIVQESRQLQKLYYRLITFRSLHPLETGGGRPTVGALLSDFDEDLESEGHTLANHDASEVRTFAANILGIIRDFLPEGSTVDLGNLLQAALASAVSMHQAYQMAYHGLMTDLQARVDEHVNSYPKGGPRTIVAEGLEETPDGIYRLLDMNYQNRPMAHLILSVPRVCGTDQPTITVGANRDDLLFAGLAEINNRSRFAQVDSTQKTLADKMDILTDVYGMNDGPWEGYLGSFLRDPMRNESRRYPLMPQSQYGSGFVFHGFSNQTDITWTAGRAPLNSRHYNNPDANSPSHHNFMVQRPPSRGGYHGMYFPEVYNTPQPLLTWPATLWGSERDWQQIVLEDIFGDEVAVWSCRVHSLHTCLKFSGLSQAVIPAGDPDNSDNVLWDITRRSQETSPAGRLCAYSEAEVVNGLTMSQHEIAPFRHNPLPHNARFTKWNQSRLLGTITRRLLKSPNDRLHYYLMYTWLPRVMPRTARQLRLVVATLEVFDIFLWGTPDWGEYVLNTTGSRDGNLEQKSMRQIVNEHLSDLDRYDIHSPLTYPYFLKCELMRYVANPRGAEGVEGFDFTVPTYQAVHEILAERLRELLTISLDRRWYANNGTAGTDFVIPTVFQSVDNVHTRITMNSRLKHFSRSAVWDWHREVPFYLMKSDMLPVGDNFGPWEPTNISGQITFEQLWASGPFANLQYNLYTQRLFIVTTNAEGEDLMLPLQAVHATLSRTDLPITTG